MDSDSIVVGDRHRKDLGDVKRLAASISAVGLLHPIVVTPDGTLIAGERRLAAVKLLGWNEVPATVVDLDSIVHGEAAENFERKDFTPTEAVAIKRAIEPAEREAAKERQGTRTDRLPGKLPQGRARDRVAHFTGYGERTLDKADEIVAAAEADPEKFGHLPAEMDRTGKVSGAYRKLRIARDEKRVLSLVPVEGKYKTLIVDPPWDYELLSLAGRAAPRYATMSHAELLALPVPAWADENCHLYLWTTNNFMTRAVDLMAHWGFAHKTVLTWVKPRWGLGSYFRNSTEHALFGVRGDLRTRSDSIATHFEAPVGEHSVKPQAFYDLVLEASYPPVGEAFQRTARDGIRNLYED